MVSTVVARGRSMDERLKSLRSLHQMLCVAAAAVLAFAMTPDRSKEYRAALDELETLQQLLSPTNTRHMCKVYLRSRANQL